jgi:hypothetical protein
MDALFAAARDTLLELLADPRYLGAQPGIQLALHTWCCLADYFTADVPHYFVTLGERSPG